MTSYSLTHLKQLEAESIHVIREVVAEWLRERGLRQWVAREVAVSS